MIITDVNMPVMGGLAMLSALRKKGIKCHAIIIAGEKVDIKNSGLLPYTVLKKPMKLETLKHLFA